MGVVYKENKDMIVDKYNPEPDKHSKNMLPSKKLAKAKAYFEKHGLPGFDKILKEAEEREKQTNTL